MLAVMTVSYLALAMLTIFVPLPRLGIVFSIDSFQGDWAREPYRALAFGFLYFLVLGIYELFKG